MKLIKFISGVKYGIMVTGLVSLFINPIMACFWVLSAIFLSLEEYRLSKNE